METVFTNKQRSDAIIEWISTHQLISRHALCALVGYDSSHLLKCINGERTIPAKYLDEFEMELGKYGFIKDLN